MVPKGQGHTCILLDDDDAMTHATKKAFTEDEKFIISYEAAILFIKESIYGTGNMEQSDMHVCKQSR